MKYFLSMFIVFGFGLGSLPATAATTCPGGLTSTQDGYEYSVSDNFIAKCWNGLCYGAELAEELAGISFEVQVSKSLSTFHATGVNGIYTFVLTKTQEPYEVLVYEGRVSPGRNSTHAVPNTGHKEIRHRSVLNYSILKNEAVLCGN